MSGYDQIPEHRWRNLNLCQLQFDLLCRLPWKFKVFALTLMGEMLLTMPAEEVRRKEVGPDAAARQQLEKTRWLWRKNRQGLTEKKSQRWEQLKKKAVGDRVGARDAIGHSKVVQG